MLTSLDFIAAGKPWPPEDSDENARLAEHAKMRQVYNGLHDKVFPSYISYLSDSSKDSKKQPVILDWPALATGNYLNLLLGEEPEVLAGERKDLPERPDEQAFIDCSRYGLGLYEISDSGIQALNPENCYIVTTPGNIQQYQALVFFATWKQKIVVAGKEEEHEYVKFTIHTKSKIKHEVYEIVSKSPIDSVPGLIVLSGSSSGKVLAGPLKLKDFPAYVGLEVEQDGSQVPPVDDLLVVVVQNKLTSERYYGQSDYTPAVLSLTENLEMLFARRAEVLAKFAAPTPVIPHSATVFDHGTQEWVYRPGQPIILEPGDQQPFNLPAALELTGVENAIDQAMDQLMQMLQLSRALLAGKDAGQAESGTALRIRLIPTLAKVSRYARTAEKAISKVINLWSQLHPPAIPIDSITVNLQDGIPEDPMETAQTATLWDAMGALSLERKLILQGLKEDSEAFKAELTRLKKQQEENKPEPPVIELPGKGEGEEEEEEIDGSQQQPAQ